MTKRLFVAVLSVAVVASACRSGMPGASVTPGSTGAAPTSSAWVPLFDGTTLAKWKGYKVDAVPSGWRIEAGTLAKDKPVADIVSRDEFGDFELMLEWKIGEGGNAGIFYRGTEEYDHIYWSAPEYQLLDDDKAPDGKNPLTRAATDYALYARTGGQLKPIGEWNETRILVKGAHVEHWLNGAKVVEYEFGSADWKAKVAGSKFKDWPNYGLAKRGRIALQGDHAGTLAFRNIKIRDLR